MVDLYQNIRPASFRGIAFDTPDDSSKFGRRIKTHEYPGRNNPVHEDSGLMVQSFSFTAVVRGADYYNRALALETALTKYGSGKLVHPYYGEIDVIVKTANRVHSSNKIGEIVFRVEFEKYGAPVFPTAITDTAVKIKASSDALFLSIENDFSSRFNGAKIPDFIANDAISRLNDYTNNVKAVLGVSSFRPAIAWPSSWQLGDAPTLAVNITSLYRGIVKLKNSPLIGGTLFGNNIQSANIISLVRSLMKSSDYSVAISSGGSTGTQAVRGRNASSLDLIQRSSSLAGAGEAVRLAKYESQEQAISVRNDFSEKMEAVLDDLGEAGWDSSWSAAQNLNVAVIQDINVRIGRLPKTIQIQNSSLKPAISLANRLYGDYPDTLFERALDIATRNSAPHPGFIPAGSLEVLI